MSVLRVEIRQGNAAFAQDADRETASILRKLADRIESGDAYRGVLHDGHGGPCGGYEFSEED
jgi:hypothetical protein